MEIWNGNPYGANIALAFDVLFGSSSNFLHPLSPRQANSRSDDGEDEGCSDSDPELGARLFESGELVGIVKEPRWVTVAKVVGTKTQFREAGRIRKSANGHCAAMNVSKNADPPTTAWRHGFERTIAGHSKSKARAGMISSNGKGMGMK